MNIDCLRNLYIIHETKQVLYIHVNVDLLSNSQCHIYTHFTHLHPALCTVAQQNLSEPLQTLSEEAAGMPAIPIARG